MKITLIGATGFVGTPLLTEILSRGHAVMALSRDPARLTPRPGLSFRTGDALKPANVAAA